MNLTPEQIDNINKTIAEACGWLCVDIPITTTTAKILLDPMGVERDLPGYFHDLNACREMAESIRDVEVYTNYLLKLRLLCQRALQAPEEASAPQRCEAFIRTVLGDKAWEELVK